ncbi:hypothetical protein POF50_032305 [Streptomyces sp. SL13]|uniref:HEXXH motif domain-containing protein n=1 Tax=Streptantibioticus silvisoli TaxID=2705255 RepID=A0AA90H5M1_9ACTN|nr:hypothetical protein [Streptantibioticus silvisoli]MDI5973974.1 hypothetical protein [Streptantibioticus silvisoli]
MFFLRGPEEGLEDVVTLAAPFTERQNLTITALKAGYQAYLCEQQPKVPARAVRHTEFVRDAAWRQELSAWFHDPSSVQGAAERNHPSDGAAMDEILAGFEALCAVEPDLAPLFDLTVNQVFVQVPPQASGSGSSFDCVGLIYVNPRAGWTRQDTVECLVHEFAHTLLYLDAMRHTHHPDYRLLDLPENQAETAITGRLRSIFFAFQSFLIAAEILTIRTRHPRLCSGNGIHGSTPEILATARRTYDACMAHPNLDALATPRLRGLLDDAYNRLRDIEHGG